MTEKGIRTLGKRTAFMRKMVLPKQAESLGLGNERQETERERVEISIAEHCRHHRPQRSRARRPLKLRRRCTTGIRRVRKVQRGKHSKTGSGLLHEKLVHRGGVSVDLDKTLKVRLPCLRQERQSQTQSGNLRKKIRNRKNHFARGSCVEMGAG